jgi:hypothetical protein
MLASAFAFAFKLMEYIDKFFLTANHRDWMRLRLIAIYGWIEDNTFTTSMMIVAQKLTSRGATSLYVVLSALFFLFYILPFYDSALRELSINNNHLPNGAKIPSGKVMLVVFAGLVLPISIVSTWIVRTVISYFAYGTRISRKSAFFAVLYVSYLIISEIFSSRIGLVLLNLAKSDTISDNVIIFLALPFYAYGALSAYIFLYFWQFILFAPLSIMSITLICAMLLLITYAIEAFVKKFIDVASSPQRSPFAFMAASFVIFFAIVKFFIGLVRAL